MELFLQDIFIANFYLFTKLDDLAFIQKDVQACCEQNDVRGIVLLAPEGINATISGTHPGVMNVLELLKRDPRFSELTWKESTAEEQPFRKIRVRLKKEIITMGVPDIDPTRLAGTYVKPEDWNELINDPNVILIDTRNDYEVEIGSFKNAINPNIQSFGDFPQWLDDNINPSNQPRVAMFCTGGIRCEKSTALLKQAGVREVYHLEGGILKYLEQIPEDQGLWSGQCFVFDQRVSVGHGLEAGQYELCKACRRPISVSDKQSKTYRKGISCPHCHDQTTEEQKDRFAERQKQIELAKARGEEHFAN